MAGRPLRRERAARTALNNGRWRPTLAKKARNPSPFLSLWVDPTTSTSIQLQADAFSQPGVWGITVADIFNHLLRMAAQQGTDPQKAGHDMLEYFEHQIKQPLRAAGARAGDPVIVAWNDDRGMPNFQIRDVCRNFGSWGILLSDIVNSIAKSYEQKGQNFNAAKAEIIEFFYKEVENPGESEGSIFSGEES